MRDFYGDLGEQGLSDKGDVFRLEQVLQLKDMSKAANKLRSITKAQLAHEVRDVMKYTSRDGTLGRDIYRTVDARREAIQTLLAERWK